MKTVDQKIDKSLPEGFRFNPDIPSYSNDPVVIRKKKEAQEFIKKHGLPEGWKKQ